MIIEFTTWISFVGTVLILTLIPGPSVLLVTAHSMSYGSRKSSGTILGDLSANLLQIVLASLGLASVVVASGEIFQLIKWAGVAYLIFIGIKKIVSVPKSNHFEVKNQHRAFKSLYLEGFLMSAANPKAIVFFAALFPLFIDTRLAFIPQTVVLAVTFLALDGLSLLVYSLFATKLKTYLEDQKKLHWQNRIVGSLLVLSGLMLSLVKRSNH